MNKIRIRYSKMGRMKFLSHLELAKLVERAFRRKGIRLMFSNGFNPHAKLSFASPLSVGVESDYEVMEVEIFERIDLNVFDDEDFFPRGISVLDAKYTDDKKTLMANLAAVEYKVTLDKIGKNEIAKFMAQDEIVFQKKSKKGKINNVDMLDFIQICRYNEEEGNITLRIKAGNNGSVKAVLIIQRIIEFCQLGECDYSYMRTKIYFSEGDVFE